VHRNRREFGSVTLEGTTYIIELMFTAEQVGLGEVDSLLAKVGSKADNTMGLLLSMSGSENPSAAGNKASHGRLRIRRRHRADILS
jgi:hypothetical protein